MKASRASLFFLIAVSFAMAALGMDKVNSAITSKYLQAKDYASLVDYLTSLASQRVPETNFEVGYAMLLWISDPKAKESPTFKMDDVLVWIRRGAKEKDDRAIDFLLNGYSLGKYGLKKSDEISDCWGNALLDNLEPDVCLRMDPKE